MLYYKYKLIECFQREVGTLLPGISANCTKINTTEFDLERVTGFNYVTFASTGSQAPCRWQLLINVTLGTMMLSSYDTPLSLSCSLSLCFSLHIVCFLAFCLSSANELCYSLVLSVLLVSLYLQP